MGTLVIADGGFDLQKKAGAGGGDGNREGEAGWSPPLHQAPPSAARGATEPTPSGRRPAGQKYLLTFPTEFVSPSVGIRQSWLPYPF